MSATEPTTAQAECWHCFCIVTTAGEWSCHRCGISENQALSEAVEPAKGD